MSQIHTVQSGDTLWGIARANGMGLGELLELNPTFRSRPDLIHPGEVVRLAPEARREAASHAIGGAPAPAATSGAHLRRGSSGEPVRSLQRSLAAAGFDPGPVDGRFGPRTEAAVRSFQQSRGLTVDGIAGPRTLAALASAAAPQATLRQGASGEGVRELQQTLAARGFDPGPVDGRFGPRTDGAVRAFQSARGLAVDGIVGPQTWASLRSEGAGPPTLRQGARNPVVSHLQRSLKAHGFDPGPVDGWFGPRTANAVRAFQRSQGLAVDGIVGPRTWARLGGLEEPPAPPTEPPSNPAPNVPFAWPEHGSLSLDGAEYTIRNGELLGGDGRRAGAVLANGTIQLDGEDAPRQVFGDLNARVILHEIVGGNRVERLNLHAADPHGILNGASIHPAIRARTQAVLSRARSEGLDLRVVSGFRSVEEQDRLYAQGRTAPGNIVTNARGGSSWHNYGLAIDIAFNDANGQPVWPENANWARYGQIAVAEGLTWGGNFRNFVDRPHIEYHPGLGPGDASTLLALYRQGGLTRVWNHLGYD